jgi:hypothetical protein
MQNRYVWGIRKLMQKNAERTTLECPEVRKFLDNGNAISFDNRGNMKELVNVESGLTRHLMELQGGFYAGRDSLISFSAGGPAEGSLPFRPLWSSSSFARSSFEDISGP